MWNRGKLSAVLFARRAFSRRGPFRPAFPIDETRTLFCPVESQRCADYSPIENLHVVVDAEDHQRCFAKLIVDYLLIRYDNCRLCP